jgi:hypothetical protein
VSPDENLAKQASACRGKTRYPDKAIARRAMRRTRRHPDCVVQLTIYRCPICSGWHLTSQDRTVRARSRGARPSPRTQGLTGPLT